MFLTYLVYSLLRPSPRNSHFSKETCFLISENGIRQEEPWAGGALGDHTATVYDGHGLPRRMYLVHQHLLMELWSSHVRDFTLLCGGTSVWGIFLPWTWVRAKVRGLTWTLNHSFHHSEAEWIIWWFWKRELSFLNPFRALSFQHVWQKSRGGSHWCCQEGLGLGQLVSLRVGGWGGPLWPCC